jgi:hypothetical protein
MSLINNSGKIYNFNNNLKFLNERNTSIPLDQIKNKINRISEKINFIQFKNTVELEEYYELIYKIMRYIEILNFY